MRYLAVIKIAFRALRRNKMRTVLTMLGIIIGVGAVIAMVALGRGAKAQVEARIAALGQNVIQVFSGSVNRGGVLSGFGGAGTLTVEDALAVQNEVPGVLAVSPEVRQNAQITAGENNWSTQVMGEGVDYLTIRVWALAEGTMFNETDVRSAAKVCVLGKTTANNLFPDGDDPVGKIIRISMRGGSASAPMKVLGVLTVKGANMGGQDQDDLVIVPYTTAMKRFSGATTLRQFQASAVNAAQLVPVQNGITELLRQRHRIQQGRDDDFIIRNQQEITEAQTATTEVMTALLAGVATISLIVGGIGIMNIMLVSVTERTREIGIRMAVGARGQDILLQFLIEAVTLSSTGGILGILLGIGGAKMLTIVKNWPTLVSPNSIIIAFLFSAGVGIFFGFYPARKASKLDPIDALRYE
jgi:putative ABC transport system permease protein